MDVWLLVLFVLLVLVCIYDPPIIDNNNPALTSSCPYIAGQVDLIKSGNIFGFSANFSIIFRSYSLNASSLSFINYFPL